MFVSQAGQLFCARLFLSEDPSKGRTAWLVSAHHHPKTLPEKSKKDVGKRRFATLAVPGEVVFKSWILCTDKNVGAWEVISAPVVLRYRPTLLVQLNL